MENDFYSKIKKHLPINYFSFILWVKTARCLNMNKLITFFLTGLLLFLVVVVASSVPGRYREYQQARETESAIAAEVRAMHEENKQKELFLRHIYDDPHFLQQQAR